MLDENKNLSIVSLLQQPEGTTITQIQRKCNLGYKDVIDYYFPLIENVYKLIKNGRFYKIEDKICK